MPGRDYLSKSGAAQSTAGNVISLQLTSGPHSSLLRHNSPAAYNVKPITAAIRPIVYLSPNGGLLAEGMSCPASEESRVETSMPGP